ncbi:MAG: tetratricopeptide repeat protein [SAR324 cluster bacterium]|nr:tetratricopeptide repeat protein [SAR324 cluster bacterium]
MASLKSVNLLKWVVLIILPLVVYFYATDAEYIIDDNKFFLEDPLMTDPEGLIKIWLSPTDNNRVWPYLPLTRSSFWIERQIAGFNSRVSHWINIILHLLTVIILWQISERWLKKGAWWIALLFSVHPVYVQSVAWVAERKNLLAALFFILSIGTYLQFQEKKLKAWYALSLSLFFFALLSKTSVVMLPVILIILHLWFGLKLKKEQFIALLPFFMLSMAMAWLRIWFEVNTFGVIVDTRTFLEKLLTAAHIPFFYLSKFFVPFPLVFIYPKWSINPNEVLSYFPSVSLFITTAILFWKYQSWGKPMLLGAGAFGIMLFPVLGFFANAWTQFSFVTDHWLHLPSISLIVLLILASFRLQDFLESRNGSSVKYLFSALAIASVALLSAISWNQVLAYKNPESLWLATIEKNQEAWIAHQELGRIYQEKKQYEQAVLHSGKSLEIKKDLFRAYHNRGNVYADLGQYARAIEDFTKALAAYPGFLEAYNNRGNAYYHLKEYALALQDYNKALTIDPGFVDAYSNRAHVYFQLKQYPHALQDYNVVLELDPNSDAFYDRGNLYSLLKKSQDAIKDFTRAIEFNPDYTQAYHNRGLVHLIQLHDPKSACPDLEQACQLGECKTYQLAQRQKICR